jgi:hypothetical protein
MDANVRQNHHAPTAMVESGMFSPRERDAIDADPLRRIVLYLILAVAAVLGALEVTLARVGDSSAKQEAPWISPLSEMDGALARGDFSTAATARHKADLAALASSCWEGYLAVGDGALRLGEAREARSAMEPEARRAYLSAMVRARNARSLEGTLRVTDAFARLGDHDMVEQGVRIARELAGSDEKAMDRVDEFVQQWAGGDRPSNVRFQ